MSRRFRNLVSKSHKDADAIDRKISKKEASEQIYTHKIGMKLTKMVNSNLKRDSYNKYERDVALATTNNDEKVSINQTI